jgi:hypothetical protein
VLKINFKYKPELKSEYEKMGGTEKDLVEHLPFSSLPKYLVHFSLRASRLNDKELFLHLPESNHRIDPSFLTYIMPVPAGKSAPQNEHLRFFGM